MSFTNLQPKSGPFSLAPGASMRVWMWYGGGGKGQEAGKDVGAQWIMADPIDPAKSSVSNTMPASLRVSDFTKVRDYWVSEGEGDYLAVVDLTKTVVRYEVTVTNVGKHAVRFSIQGGGNT